MSIFGLIANLVALVVYQYLPELVAPVLCLPFGGGSMETQIVLGFLIIVPLAAISLFMDWATAMAWNIQIFFFIFVSGC